MANYHRFVFDQVARRYLGRFEEMYRAEAAEHFDSWHQEDGRNLTKQVCLALLDSFNFGEVLDIGCGKGAFTHHLKKVNNRVLGVDVSATALAVAQGRYPDVEFRELCVGRDPLPVPPDDRFDLAVCLEALSYLDNWREVLTEIATKAQWALIALYLPENAIGFVKSFDELVAEFSANFDITERIDFVSRRQLVLFGRAKIT